MKKIYLMLGLLALSTASFAQEKAKEESKDSFYLNTNLGLGFNIGLFTEKSETEKIGGLNKTSLFSLNYGTIGVTNGYTNVFSKGWEVGLGERVYLKKEKWSGLYYQTLFNYGKYKFDDAIYSGTFEYVGINPDFGYKIKLGKFLIDPSIGFQYNIEIMGRGDVDNTLFNNVFFKAGLKLGYGF